MSRAHQTPRSLRSALRPWLAPFVKLRLLWLYRGYRTPAAALRYLALDHELDNFTYDITNRDELAAFLSMALGRHPGEMQAFIRELDEDDELATSIAAALASRSDRNRTMPYGRRIGWYAVVRTIKPRVVVETGVHDGLGSAVLLSALRRNRDEGSHGSLVAFDVRDDVGWLVPTRLRDQYELRIEEALQALPSALDGRQIDVFIHDSDHRYEHETSELELARTLCAPHAVLISDNAHAGTALRDFCERHSLPFYLFREIPRDHFYHGAGIGMTTVAGRITLGEGGLGSLGGQTLVDQLDEPFHAVGPRMLP